MATSKTVTSLPPEDRAAPAAESDIVERFRFRHGSRNGFICALVVAACLWLAYPAAEIGFIDDWSYAKTAQTFAQTGHFVYNGWAAPILGWQVVWGALFIRLFGFSFTVVRLSTLFVAMATVALFHAVLLRFGVNTRNAVLGTLTLGLSPLFLPLAASYMTEVPGLFAILLCLYLCQRAVVAGSDRATIAWLCLAAASNVVGGTARQIAWLGVLVMVPSTGWLLRRRRGVFPAALLLGVGSAASVLVCMLWFARQPYAVREPVFVGPAFGVDVALRVFFRELGVVLCLLLLVFPIGVVWLSEMRSLCRAALVRIASITLLYGLFQWKTHWTMPWIGDVIVMEFALFRSWLPGPPRPGYPTLLGREIISLLVVVTALALLEVLRSVRAVRSDAAPLASRQEMFWLLAPFVATYFIFLQPRAYQGVIYDRYLLPIMPIAIICLVLLYQRRIAERLPVISAVVLAVFAVLAIGGTHDWFAWHRAQLNAINEIRADGVPRTGIQGGSEYDGWTQIEATGHMNGSYTGISAGAPPPKDCQLEFAQFTPAIHPRFTAAFDRMWCLAPSKFPPVHYRTWLPRYSNTVYVQEIPQ